MSRARVAEETDPMDLSEAPITGGQPGRELPARATYVIVGSGFAGLCMAIKLKQAGRDDFVILEKGDDVGGTWRENTPTRLPPPPVKVALRAAVSAGGPRATSSRICTRSRSS